MYLHLLSLAFLLPALMFAQPPTYSNLVLTDVFEEPVTQNSHASTIVELGPDRLLVAWFGGSHEGAKDVGIYASNREGGSWSEPRQLVTPLVTEGDTLPCWNPVLYRSLGGKLYLFYKVGKNPREWFGAMLTSDDDGAQWSAPRYLPDGFLGPIRNKPIEPEPGVLLCGSSTENPTTDAWRVHLEQYNESAGSWERIAVPNPQDFEIIQPTFLQHGGDTLQILCRSKHDRLVSSWSYDKGNNWTEADTVAVPNSNSGVDAVTLASGDFLLVNNPLPRGKNWWNGRSVLDVEWSTDGLEWQSLFDLERHAEGEYSYPAIIQAADGTVHVVYTYDRRTIRHASFRLGER
ncbi:alpha-L-fucosidase [Lewinella marina]|uniref:Glycosyl hydrolase n=1 Tax=Neolewinella marina TaxID=438751 RepID=A0A2G0CB37_9BACT|nr:sialidase family protein [Neolewinella marina]NJB84280.1 alpha-L-fucosidase [Neolewinella marina]PHK97137.1 glycosyl hydrolase [Neolewinella marina]